MTTLHGRYAPPRPTPPALVGQRVALVVVDEHTGRSRYSHGWRAASTIFDDPKGRRRAVRVAAEDVWFSWLDEPTEPPIDRTNLETQVCPDSYIWPADLVWSE